MKCEASLGSDDKLSSATQCRERTCQKFVMDATPGQSQIVKFGLFEVDLERRELRKSGVRFKLHEQPFQILTLLLDRAGDLVTREEIRQSLWPGNTFVEFDNGLNVAVTKLRTALSDNADNPRFVETVPKRGYRFVAPVTVTSRIAPASVPPETTAPGIAVPALPHILSASPTLPVTARHPTEGRWAVGLTVIIIIIVILAGFGAYRERASFAGRASAKSVSTLARVSLRPSVAVLGFKNLTGQADSAWISTALTEMLATELATGQKLHVIPGENVARARMEIPIPDSSTFSPETLKKVRDNLGSDFVLAGSYTLLTDQPQPRIRVDLTLQNSAAGETIASVSETGNKNDLFQLASEAGRELRQKLGAGNLSLAEAATVRKTFSEDPKAARLYAEGLARMRVFESMEARDLLAEAVAIDPSNAKAHSALAAAWSMLGYDATARDQAKLAFDQTADLSREDQLSIEGQYRELTHEWPRAVDVYRTLWGFFPDNVDYALRLTKTQVTAGQPKDALLVTADLRKLPARLGEDARIDVQEAVADISTGEFQKATTAAETASRKARATGARLLEAQASMIEARALERLGQSAKSLQASDRSISLFQEAGDLRGVAVSTLFQGDVRYDAGNFKEAIDSFQTALALYSKIGTQTGMGASFERIGNVFYEEGKLADAKSNYERALAIEREIGDKRAIPSQLGNIAGVLDALGNLSAARKMQEESLAGFRENNDQRGVASTLNNLAGLQLELGDLSAAEKNFGDSQLIDQKINYKRGEAYGLYGSGDVHLAQNKLAASRADYEKALAIAHDLGSENQGAQFKVGLARLALEEGHFAEAETMVRDSLAQFEKDHTDSDAAWANAVLARILLAQRKLPEAAGIAERAVALSLPSASRTPHFEAALADSRVKALSGHAATAVKELDSSIAQAHRDGNLSYEFELRLTRAEIAAGTDNAAANRARLVELEREARSHGFLLVAAKATKQLGASS